jgi:hypothetical protein
MVGALGADLPGGGDVVCLLDRVAVLLWQLS